MAKTNNEKMEELSKIRELFLAMLKHNGFSEIERDYCLLSVNKDGTEFTMTLKLKAEQERN